MSKDDVLDLIVKAFGVGLLVAAIAAIPAMIENVILVGGLARQGAMGEGPEFTADFWNVARSTHIASGLGALAKFLVFALASFNFLRSGSLVRRLMGSPVEQAGATDAAAPRC